MRYIPTSRLTPGMALGQDIYDGAGRLLLARHLLLTAEYISNLEFLGFPGIYIDDEFTQGIEIQQVVTPEVRCRALKLISDMFAFEAPEGDLPVSEVKLRMTVENVVEDIRQSIAFFDEKHFRPVKDLWITDDNFFADREWAVSVLQAIIASGIHYRFNVQARYEVGFDDEMLDLLKKAGAL